MGYKWEVSIWKEFRDKNGTGWKYESVYYGDSLFKAIITLIQSKRKSLCVKLEWRYPKR